LRQVGSGTSLCRFSIANNRNYTSNGERREEVNFFNCIAWGRQGEIINQYCRKGMQVAVEGRLRQNTWDDKEGKKQSTVEVYIDQLQMLGSRQSGEAGSSEGSWGSRGSAGGGYSSEETGGGYGRSGAPAPDDYQDSVDDDIPF